MTRAMILCLVLAGCVGQPATNGACLAYGAQRATMPPLGTEALDEWVAVLDTAMTGACFP